MNISDDMVRAFWKSYALSMDDYEANAEHVRTALKYVFDQWQEVTDEMVDKAMRAWSGYYCDCNDANVAGNNRDAMSAALQSIAQPVKVPDEIFIVLDECRADLNCLFSRVAADGSFAQAAANSLRHKLDKVASFIYAINEKKL